MVICEGEHRRLSWAQWTLRWSSLRQKSRTLPGYDLNLNGNHVSFFRAELKSPGHDHILEIITFLVHVRTPLLKPASWGKKPQKIVSFNCKTAAIQRLVTGAYGSISHEFLTCPYFGGIFIAIRYLIMLGFFPRIFHILVAQLRWCFCSASSCEEHIIISKISLEHKYEKNL